MPKLFKTIKFKNRKKDIYIDKKGVYCHHYCDGTLVGNGYCITDDKIRRRTKIIEYIKGV